MLGTFAWNRLSACSRSELLDGVLKMTRKEKGGMYQIALACLVLLKACITQNNLAFIDKVISTDAFDMGCTGDQ